MSIDELSILVIARDAYAFSEIGKFQLGKQIEPGRLVKSLRVSTFDGFSLSITLRPVTSQLRRSTAGDHTTPADVTLIGVAAV